MTDASIDLDAPVSNACFPHLGLEREALVAGNNGVVRAAAHQHAPLYIARVGGLRRCQAGMKPDDRLDVRACARQLERHRAAKTIADCRDSTMLNLLLG